MENSTKRDRSQSLHTLSQNTVGHTRSNSDNTVPIKSNILKNAPVNQLPNRQVESDASATTNKRKNEIQSQDSKNSRARNDSQKTSW